MSDDEGKQMGDIVSEVTVKALREFSSGSFHPDDKQSPKGGSRPGSAAKGSPAGSVKGSRPGSAKPGSRPGSARPESAAKGSRPTSARSQVKSPESVTGAKQGTPEPRPGSARPQSGQVTSRPQSAAKGSRPGSRGSRPPTSQGHQDEEGLVVSGSRPGSARQEAAAEPGSRPQSAVKDTRPQSASKGSRPASAAKGSRPASAAKDSRPASRVSRPPSAAQVEASPRQSGQGSPKGSAHGQGSPQVEGSLPAPASRPASDHAQPPVPEPTQDEDGFFMEHDDFPPMTNADNMQTTLGGGGGGDGGSDEDEDEEMMGLEEEEDDEDEDSEGEAEMVVLDPDHPLMQRFQRALKSHLLKQNEKVTLELRELLESVRSKRTDREEVGVELYGVQQELAKHQMALEKRHDSYASVSQQRNQCEGQLGDVRDQYRSNQTTMNQEKKRAAELQAEVENLALRLFYMENAKEDVRSDIAVMKRAAEKAETEVTRAEQDKQKQDLFVDRLVERVDKLQEEIALFDAQITAQTEETKAAREALMEAHMEIEAISLEKKQLFQQWSSSVIGMRRRDEAHAAMQDALNQQQQRVLSLETEIEGYKKSISGEQEQNEKLTLILSKTEADITTVKRMLASCQAKHDALKNEYATYTRMLHETEQALNRANTDKTLKSNEVVALRKQIEREYLERVRLEDEILEKLRGQLTLDKAATYTDKLTQKLQLRTRDMDQQVAIVENDISKDALELSHTKSRAERLAKILSELDDNINRKNTIISKSDNEMIKQNAMIERKQGIIDQYNKKLEHMISQAGGVELGPLEIQINSIQKSIEGENQDIVELKQMWMRNQSELVSLSKEKDGQGRDVEILKKQLTILSQKKLRIEGEINTQTGEASDLKRNLRNMENDMLKMNMLLHKERGTEYDLQQDNILRENHFIGTLKEAEREAIGMQEKLEGMTEEKERLLNSLVEAERQIMLWEKKTQLAKETRAAVDSEAGQGEIRAMKAEIHRMTVRYNQLMKQQERMIQEMEKAVSRRDTIVTRGDAQAKMNKKVMTKGTFQRQMNELKKKIKKTIQDATTCDSDIVELRQHQQQLSSQLEEGQLGVQQLQSNMDTLDGDIDRLVETKHKNMADLLAKQQKTKHFVSLRAGKYTRLVRNDGALDIELRKQVDRQQALLAITDRLQQEFPHAQPAIRKVALAYGSRSVPGEGEYLGYPHDGEYNY